MTMNSPSTEREVTDTKILGSYRTTGRYSDRYKALMQDSPPRENGNNKISTTIRTSPVRLDYMLKEAQEKKNENKMSDWQRRLSDKVDTALEHLRPTPTTSATSTTTNGETLKERKEVPRYMQSTRSYEGRVQTKRDPLGVRAGGISKRVGTARIPHFKSTTDINAIEEIRGEMAPDDIYIPMAARIKLFERGLGNGANKPVPTTSTTSISSNKSNRYQHHHSNNNNSSHTNKRNEQKHIPTTVAPIKRNNHINSNKQTEESIGIEQKSITREKSTELKPTSRKITNVEVKPFKFATSDRALHYKQVFEDRLKLWQVKDVEHQKNERIRELKRKSSASLSNDKNKARRMH